MPHGRPQTPKSSTRVGPTPGAQLSNGFKHGHWRPLVAHRHVPVFGTSTHLGGSSFESPGALGGLGQGMRVQRMIRGDKKLSWGEEWTLKCSRVTSLMLGRNLQASMYRVLTEAGGALAAPSMKG